MRTVSGPQIDQRYRVARSAAPPAFPSIVCGVDGSPAGQEAARQAAVLAGARGKLAFVCVAYATGVGATAQATISNQRAEEALAHAVEAAKEAGASATTELAHGPETTHELLARVEGADLAVVGSHGGSRGAGIMLGSVASTLAHEAPVPVLVARSPQLEAPFPVHLLVASDGSAGSAGATRLAAAIARAHGSDVVQLHVDGAEAPKRHRMAVEAAELMRATGTEPVVRTESGTPHERIAELARVEPASLVVIGSRGLLGIKALGSVSERVVHEAPCSVLVARPRPSRSE